MSNVKSYIFYIILFALLMAVFWVSYVISSILIYFYLGYILLPFVVITFLYGIYWLWKWVFRKPNRNLAESIILALSYCLYLYLLVVLDTTSWDGESNFYKFVSLVKWIIETW